MLAVTIGAHRRFFDSGQHGLAVNAFLVNLFHILMAASAGFGNMRPVDPAIGILRAMQIMRPVAVTADRRVDVALGKSHPVHCIVVGGDRVLLRQQELRHSFGVGVTAGASGFDVSAIDGGPRVARV